MTDLDAEPWTDGIFPDTDIDALRSVAGVQDLGDLLIWERNPGGDVFDVLPKQTRVIGGGTDGFGLMEAGTSAFLMINLSLTPSDARLEAIRADLAQVRDRPVIVTPVAVTAGHTDLHISGDPAVVVQRTSDDLAQPLLLNATLSGAAADSAMAARDGVAGAMRVVQSGQVSLPGWVRLTLMGTAEGADNGAALQAMLAEGRAALESRFGTLPPDASVFEDLFTQLNAIGAPGGEASQSAGLSVELQTTQAIPVRIVTDIGSRDTPGQMPATLPSQTGAFLPDLPT